MPCHPALDLLAIGLDTQSLSVPEHVRLHTAHPRDVHEVLMRYAPVLDGIVIAAGLPEVEAAAASLAAGVPLAILAMGGPRVGPASTERVLADLLAQVGQPTRPRGNGGVTIAEAEDGLRAVSAWGLTGLGREKGPPGMLVARSWSATLADVVARHPPGCGVALRYVRNRDALHVGLVAWGAGTEASDARGRLTSLERALAPLLLPATPAPSQPYGFERLTDEAAAAILMPVHTGTAVCLRAPSIERMSDQLGPTAWEERAVLEGAEGLDHPTAPATSNVGSLLDMLRAIHHDACVEVAVETAPLTSDECAAAIAFARAAQDEQTGPLRLAASRAARLAARGDRVLRAQVSVHSASAAVPPALVVEAARTFCGDPAITETVTLTASTTDGVLWSPPVSGNGALTGRVAPDEAGAMLALPPPSGRPRWGVPVLAAPGPRGLPTEGVRIGTTASGEPVRLSTDALRRHLYVVGGTGTGKSQFLVHVAARRATAGHAVLVIDPHGDTAARVARAVRSAGRHVHEVDLGDAESPWRLNPIEVDPAVPNARSVLAEALLDLFGQLWNMREAGGPMFETYFRNALYLTMSRKDRPGTLRDVWRLFSDDAFRQGLLLECEDPEVVRFWTTTAGLARGEASLENISPYVLSKLSPLVSNDALDHLTSTPRSTLDVGALLDRGACVVVRLDKGRLGSYGSRLAGTVLLSRVLLAAMRRATTSPDALIVVDEFQNFVTPQMGELLAESRKYRVHFALANQTLAQVPEQLSQTVLGNAGNLCVFRPNVHDAARLAPYLAPTFDVEGLLTLPNYRAACRVLVDGAPTTPFELRSDPPSA